MPILILASWLFSNWWLSSPTIELFRTLGDPCAPGYDMVVPATD